MFERKHQPLLSRRDFAGRVGRSAVVSAVLLGASLGVGVLGYHGLARLGWIDSILNASMILTGMGPVSPLPDPAAKLFASAYALFSGVIFIASAGVVVAPLAHRLLHRFHVELADESERSAKHAPGVATKDGG
jgi:hypothetical protein